MTSIKIFAFVLLVAFVFSLFSALVGIPGEIGGMLGVPVGIGAMLFAMGRWS